MATQNALLDTQWKKLANASDDRVLIQSLDDVFYEVAAVATDVAPVVKGHVIAGTRRGISRDNIGDGYLYARVVSGGSEAKMAVSGSSVSLS